MSEHHHQLFSSMASHLGDRSTWEEFNSQLTNDFPYPWLLNQRLLVNSQHQVMVNFYKMWKNSSVFHDLIRRNAHKDTLTIFPQNPISLARAVEFCHLEKCDLTFESFQPIIQTAHEYEIRLLLDLAMTYLDSQLNASNVWQFRSIALHCTTEAVLQKVNAYLAAHIMPCSESVQFLQLNPKDVRDILSFNDLNVDNELQVFELLLKWARFDWTNREANIDTVITAIRVTYLTDAERDAMLHMVDGDSPLERVVNGIFHKNYGLRSRIVKIQSHLKPRFPHEAIFVFGGFVNKSCSQQAFVFDAYCQKWITFSQQGEHSLALPEPLMSFGIVYDELRGRIYLVGGEIQQNQATQQLLMFNLIQRVWEYKSPMHETRRDHATVLLNGKCILSLGGDNNRQVLNTVEMYCPGKNQWTYMPAMLLARSGLAAQSLGDRVFAFGGYTMVPMNELTNTCEMLDMHSNEWTFIRPMSQQRYYFQALAFEDKLYALGGGDDNFWSTVECYNPQNNQWTPVPTLRTQRADFAACIFKQEFVCLGGGDDSTSIPKVEYWNPKLSNVPWREGVPLPTNVWGHRAVCVRGVENIRPFLSTRNSRNVSK